MFQAAALLHDDVMDGSDTRRGRPAAHRQFADLHRAQGWEGSPEAFGVAGAILAGDLCLSWSDEMFTGAGLPADQLARGRAVFDRMRTELMAGQYLDMFEQVQPSTTVARARHVIRYKSAQYTVEQPLLLGGSLAGAPPELLAGYSAFGLALGEAFQLRDDVLGVFGDPTETGKPAGDDLREGKRTALVAAALDGGDVRARATVRRLLGRPELSESGVGELRHGDRRHRRPRPGREPDRDAARARRWPRSTRSGHAGCRRCAARAGSRRDRTRRLTLDSPDRSTRPRNLRARPRVVAYVTHVNDAEATMKTWAALGTAVRWWPPVPP